MWYDLAMNSEVVKHVFNGESPSLDGVQLDRISFDWNGSQADLSLLSNVFPAKPPEKWVKEGYNAAKFYLQLIDTKMVKLYGWETVNKIDVHIFKDETELLKLSAKNEFTEVEITFKFLRIQHINGYRIED
jgi:hypothetical protein